MLTPIPQRTHSSHSVSHLIRRSLRLLLTLSLLTAPLAAQTEQETKRAAADKLVAEGLQLFKEGTKESVEAAIRKLIQALPLLRSVNNASTEAITLSAIGLFYSKLGDKQKALDYYEQALPILRVVGDRQNEVATLNKIGMTYYLLGERRKALDYFTQTVLLSSVIGDRKGAASALNNIGQAYEALGEAQKALDHFAQALPLYRAIGDRAGEATTLNNVGSIYNLLGDKQKALNYYTQALLLSHAIGDRAGEASTLSNIGGAYKDLGDKQKALNYYAQALSLARAIGEQAQEAITLNNMGEAYITLDDKQKALDYFAQALSIFHTIGDRETEAATLNNMGVVYIKLGDKQKAIDHLMQSLSLSRAVGNPRGEATTLGIISYSERELGKLNDALAHIEAAIAILESLRTKIGSQELRSSFFATVQDDYEFYIDLLMRLHKQQPAAGYDGKALQASERARARSLLELLTEAGADIRQGVDPQLVARERALQQQLNTSAQRQIQLLSGPHTEAQATASAKEIENLTTELQQVETQIRQTSPRYAALTQPQPLTLAEIQTQALAADTLLLEYALGKDRSYLWAVTPTTITSYELPKRAEIEAAAREFYESVHTTPKEAAQHGLGSELQQRAPVQFAQAAARLSRMLLAPVAALLGKKRLLIVADGALQYIPFAALPAPTNATSSAAPPPLIVEHEIVSLPSASTLALLRREAGERKGATKTLAVLADPVFERTDERLKAGAGRPTVNTTAPAAPADESRGLSLSAAKSAQESGVAARDLRIPRLPATRREADAISALAPPAARMEALDFAANRATATNPALADYRFVHFATHGLLDSQHPELSGILLSMFDEQGRPQDGFLRAHEVFNLKLNADVVVLSACQTGLGKEVKGEGLVGLTRGFMYAGAPRVVVSLWSVNDAATAELMTRFYRGMLVDKLRPAQALQAAQVSMLNDKRFAAPFYWAAFTLQGEWR